MQIKHMSRHAVELLQASFGKAPKAFNAIDMTRTKAELVVAMLDAQVFGVADIHQAIVAAPTVAVNHRFERDTPSNDGLQRGFAAVGHDFGVNLALTLEQAEHGCFVARTATALAAHP